MKPEIKTEPLTEPKIKKSSKWMDHVRKHRDLNPEKSYKQCLQDSKNDYVK